MSSLPTFGEPFGDTGLVRRRASYALIAEGERIAVVKTPSSIALIGGGIELNETPEQCLHREVMEEVGWTIRIIRLLAQARQYHFSISENTHFESTSHFFIVERTITTNRPREVDHELVWLSFADAIAVLRLEYQRWAVQQFMLELGVSVHPTLREQ